jgi:hypothetical protein
MERKKQKPKQKQEEEKRKKKKAERAYETQRDPGRDGKPSRTRYARSLIDPGRQEIGMEKKKKKKKKTRHA